MFFLVCHHETCCHNVHDQKSGQQRIMHKGTEIVCITLVNEARHDRDSPRGKACIGRAGWKL